MRPTSRSAILLFAIAASCAAATSGEDRNKGVRVMLSFLGDSVTYEDSAAGTSVDYDVDSARRHGVAFSFFVPKEGRVGFSLNAGPVLTSIKRSGSADDVLMYGMAVEPGISLKLVKGLRIEAGIPLGFGVGSDSYYWADSGQKYDVAAFYYEIGLNVRPTYTFDFGLELFAQAGFLSTTWVYSVTEEYYGGSSGYSKSDTTITQTLKGATYGLGAGYRF